MKKITITFLLSFITITNIFAQTSYFDGNGVKRAIVVLLI